MPRRNKPCPVRVSHHAIERARDRGGGKITQTEVRSRLMTILRLGMPVEAGAVKVPLPGGLAAICVPSLMGGWDVVTVIREREDVG